MLVQSRNELRKVHEIDTEKLIIYVGRLVSKKGVRLLIEAFASCKFAGGATLAIVGDGPERIRLEQQCRRLGVADRTLFVGFQQPDVILKWYAMVDLFVLPSSETWGVAPIEACAAGLPVIVSDAVGCASDLRSVESHTL